MCNPKSQKLRPKAPNVATNETGNRGQALYLLNLAIELLGDVSRVWLDFGTNGVEGLAVLNGETAR